MRFISTPRGAKISKLWAKTVVLGVSAVSLALATGCGSSGSSAGPSATSTVSAAGSGTQIAAAAITIKNFGFTTPNSVSPGATVSVNNMDDTAHTVTSDTKGVFDSPAAPGSSSFVAPTMPGSYHFHCSIHPEMHGVLVVK